MALSEDVKSIIQSLLKRDPCERPTAAELLRHPWLTASHHSSAGDEDTAQKPALRRAAEGALDLQLPKLAVRGDSPLVHQLMADARSAGDSMAWSQMPGECVALKLCAVE